MKKFFTLIAVAFFTLNASAQLKWTGNDLPTAAEGVAQGYQDYWGVGYCLPANYKLIDDASFKAEIEIPTLAVTPAKKFSGNGKYNVGLQMGMANSVRGGIDCLNFLEGLTNNPYVNNRSYSNAGVEYSYANAIITITTPAEADGGKYGRVTLNYSRGGNNTGMHVVKFNANDGGYPVLQSIARCPDDNIQSHVARFSVNPGNTYYVIASDNSSIELYELAFDAAGTEGYEYIITDENNPINWTGNDLPTAAEGVAQGYQDYWGVGYCLPANYKLIDDASFKAEIEIPTLAVTPAKKFAGNGKYNVGLQMGMANSVRGGIDCLNFLEGLTNNPYVNNRSYSNAGVEYSYANAIITITTPAEADGGKYGRVTLNYSRGGNNTGMHVVKFNANDGGYPVLQSIARCPDDAVQMHSSTFSVNPGNTYYVIASDNSSIELYGIGFCPADHANYYDNNITDGIEDITTSVVAPANNNIYSIDGRFVGTEKASLKSGLYIMNGKKVVVK